MDLNKVTLIGNLGKDPELRTFQNGGRVANFSVATTRKWKTKDGEKKEATEWHNIQVSDKNLVDICERFLQKGTRVYLEGEVRTRQYEKDGATRYITEIIVPPFRGAIHIEARGKGWRDNNSEPTSIEPTPIDKKESLDPADEIPF